jgi:hypothetical protein
MVATAQFGRLDSGAFPGRPTTDDDHIIMFHYLYYRITSLEFSQSKWFTRHLFHSKYRQWSSAWVTSHLVPQVIY